MMQELTGLAAHEPGFTIQTASARSGVSEKMIRYHMAHGLLPERRRANRYRYFTEDDVACLRLIRQCTALGMQHDEIRAFVALLQAPPIPLDVLLAARISLKRRRRAVAHLEGLLDAAIGTNQPETVEPPHNEPSLETTTEPTIDSKEGATP